MNKVFDFFVALALVCSTGAALAQAPKPEEALDGTWTVKYAEGRWAREAQLELKGTTGQYRFTGGAMNRPWDTCEKVGKVPVTLEQTADGVVVIAKFSQVARFCPDSTLKFKKTSERTLDGAFADGTPVSATKQ